MGGFLSISFLKSPVWLVCYAHVHDRVMGIARLHVATV